MGRFIAVFASVYWAVLIAELIGDKSIYTVTSLALRVSRGLVMAALLAAYSAKIALAVLFGTLLLRLPLRALTLVSAAGFLVSALVIALRREEGREVNAIGWRNGVVACFASLFLTEWADPGQMVTIASTARFGFPAAVWAAGTLAMVTKGALALIIGVRLRERVPQRIVRPLAVASLSVLGIITFAQGVM